MSLAHTIDARNHNLVQDIHGEEVAGPSDWEVVQQYQAKVDGSTE